MTPFKSFSEEGDLFYPIENILTNTSKPDHSSWNGTIQDKQAQCNQIEQMSISDYLH